jgi:hypothetical protein
LRCNVRRKRRTQDDENEREATISYIFVKKPNASGPAAKTTERTSSFRRGRTDVRICTNCPHRSACCQAKDIAKPKEVVLKKTFWGMRAASQENITTEHGIYLRMWRSIQVEGAFGLLKNDFGFYGTKVFLSYWNNSIYWISNFLRPG